MFRLISKISAIAVLLCFLVAGTGVLAQEPEFSNESDMMTVEDGSKDPEPDPSSGSFELDIIGGEEAQAGAWPWMAALVSATTPSAFQGQFCGGALIKDKWVITAAHCVEGEFPSTIDVVLGRHLLSDTSGERISVAGIARHPNYNRNTLNNDIALLYLSNASSLTTIPLATLSNSSLYEPGVTATVTGWGNTSRFGAGSYPDELRQVSVPIVSNVTCNAPLANGGDVTLNMLCAGFAQGRKDTCDGDSGGPLMVPGSSGVGWVQAGITSWGIGCARPNKYGVYTRVANYEDWVYDTINAGAPPPDPCPIQLTLEDEQLYEDQISAMELMRLLYRVRDELFAQTSVGRHYTNLYYDHADQIVGMLIKHPELRSELAGILRQADSGMQLLFDDRGSEAIISPEFINSVELFLENLALHDESLDIVVNAELKRLDLDTMIGMSFEKAWRVITLTELSEGNFD